MDRLPPLCRDAFLEKMRSEVERVLGAVAEAVIARPYPDLARPSSSPVEGSHLPQWIMRGKDGGIAPV